MTDTQPRERERVRERIRVKSKSRRRRRRIGIALALLVGLGVLIGLGLIPAFAARSSLVQGRAQLEAARDALTEGDVEAAVESFRAGTVSFIKAAEQARNPVLRLFGFLPLAGRTPDAVSALAEAGGEVSRAGLLVADALAEIPGGFSAFAPKGGRIVAEPFEVLAPALEDAAVLVRAAEQRVAALPHSWLMPSVSDAREELGVQLREYAPRIQAAAALIDGLPAFLGYQGERRYFFGASNPAEARGTGGLLGSFAILTALDGNLSFSTFGPITDLPDPSPSEVEPPNPDYANRYPGAWTFWRSVNLTPDFPSAAVAIERLYEHVRGERLDGVVMADPFALEALMRVSGPVEIPFVDRLVEPEEVVAFTMNEAYSEFLDSRTRKRVLGDVAVEVVDEFLGGGFSPQDSIRALLAAASGGHLLMHSADAGLQAGLDVLGIGGALLPTNGDYLGLSFNNGAGNKVDFYAETSLEYDIRLGATGTARSEISVTIGNTAPRSGPPQYVIGPFDDRFEAGENVTAVSAFVPESAVFEGAELNGAKVDVFEAPELGHLALERQISIPSGETGTMQFFVASPRAWSGASGTGEYRLTLQLPPRVNPVETSIDIQAPAGMNIVWTSVPMDVQGNRAKWTGVPSARQRFDVRFEKPLGSRIWEGFKDFFAEPVF